MLTHFLLKAVAGTFMSLLRNSSSSDYSVNVILNLPLFLIENLCLHYNLCRLMQGRQPLLEYDIPCLKVTVVSLPLVGLDYNAKQRTVVESSKSHLNTFSLK